MDPQTPSHLTVPHLPQQRAVPPARADYAHPGVSRTVEGIEGRLLAVAEVNRTILRGGPSDEFLCLVAHRARRLVGAQAAVMFLPEEAGHLTVVAVDGRGSALLPGVRLRSEDSIAWAVMTGAAARAVDDLSSLPSAERDLLQGRLGAALFVPLTVRARVVAVLLVADEPGGGTFGHDDLAAVRTFAAQAGLAVETHLAAGAVLLDALALERRNQMVRERLRSETPVPVEDGPVLRQTLDTLAQTVVELTDAVACTIQVLTPDMTVRTMGSFGVSDEVTAAMDAAVLSGAPSPALEAITATAPVVVSNERERMLVDARFSAVREVVADLPWTSAACLPLVSPTEARGALCYYFQPDRRPSDADVAFIKLSARQAATAVANAHLLAAADKRVALEERQHLARELHDSVSQALYGIALGARAALQELDVDPDRARKPVNFVLQLAESGLAEMRALIFDLVPDSLEGEGLAIALRTQADAVRARHGVAVETRIGEVPEIATEVRTAVYRVAQEAINNAAKHAQARHVVVELDADQTDLTLQVTDDGVGFDADGHYPGHLGLESMRERTAALGGKTVVSSRRGEGTRVRAVIPRFPRPVHRRA